MMNEVFTLYIRILLGVETQTWCLNLVVCLHWVTLLPTSIQPTAVVANVRADGERKYKQSFGFRQHNIYYNEGTVQHEVQLYTT